MSLIRFTMLLYNDENHCQASTGKDAVRMKCTVCNKKAVYEVKYNGSSLCSEHFTDFVERRVKREIREQVNLKGDKVTISVAISGGKDSSVLLHLMHKILSDRRNLELKAFTIDEGIKGYRNTGLEAAKELSKKLGIEHSTISFKDNFGYELDEIVRIDGDTIPCSHCGPMRRQLMNRISEMNGADYLALGINLDDYSQSILMNVAKGDVQRMARLAPHKGLQEGLVPRILPLRKIPEKEVMLYGILAGINFDSSWCPYYEKAQRNKFRDIVANLEDDSPGTRHAIVNFFDSIRDPLEKSFPQSEMNKCAKCGAPTTGGLCTVCADIERLKSFK